MQVLMNKFSCAKEIYKIVIIRWSIAEVSATTSSDADIWEAMADYQVEWRDMTKILLVKAHAGEGGATKNAHEKQNKEADEDAEKAYAHPDSPAYRGRYCSQSDTL